MAVALVMLATSGSASAAEPGHQDRMRWAAMQLVRAQLPSGLLAYDFDFVTGAPTAEDNMVRQAGVLAFLAEYHALTGDERVRLAVERGLLALTRHSQPIQRGPAQSIIERSGVLSVPVGRTTVQRAFDGLGLLFRPSGKAWVVTSGPDYHDALTGATAMALITELHYAQSTGATRFRPSRKAWLNGLLALQVPGRGFRASPTSIEASPFSDGEAWLALALYHRFQPDDDATRLTLERLDGTMMRTYGRLRLEFYQWGTIAAAVRFETTSDQRFLDFIAQQARDFLQVEPTEETRLLNSCACVEGLATAAGILAGRPGFEALVAGIERNIGHEMRLNRNLQIVPPARVVRIASDAYLTSGALAPFMGAFLEGGRNLYTRIDHTGHCLSALIKLHRYGLDPGGRGGQRASAQGR